MSKYKFVGSAADLGDGTVLNKGDVIDLTDERAEYLLSQRVALEPTNEPAANPPKE